MTDSETKRTYTGRKRWIMAAPPVILVLAIFAVVAWKLVSGSRMPLDSPVPMMYRTEAQMQSLLSAIDKHHKMYGEYPPSGVPGQKAAVDSLNATVKYLTGLPRDAWGRHFIYIRAADYNKEIRAMKNPDTGRFFNPETYQLYSTGMDAATSPDDNINNWDNTRSWRKVYENMQKMWVNAD